MYIKDDSKCKQCDGPLPIRTSIVNGKEITGYLTCEFCEEVERANRLRLIPTDIAVEKIEMPEPLPIIDADRDKYCQDFIAAMSIMGHLLKHKLVDQNRLRELIRIDNATLSDDAIRIKIAEAQINWVHIRVVESEYYQTLQKRSKQFLEVDKTKSYTELFVPTKTKDIAPVKQSKQNEIISRWNKRGISLPDCNRYWLSMFPETMPEADRKSKEKQMLFWTKLGIAPEKQQKLWIEMGNKV